MENSQIEAITRMVLEAVKKEEEKGNGYAVPIGVSARHIHLTQEHVETLFGPGYHLTKKKELMGGQFAANEQVTIVGLKLRAIENVRILGPVRKASQVEISATDAIKLGIKAPIRESGDIAGSAPIAVVGPAGALQVIPEPEHQPEVVEAVRHAPVVAGIRLGRDDAALVSGVVGGAPDHVGVGAALQLAEDGGSAVGPSQLISFRASHIVHPGAVADVVGHEHAY